MQQFLFYCQEKAPWPRHLIEGRVCLQSWVQRERCPPRWRAVASGRPQPEQQAGSSHLKLQTGSREQMCSGETLDVRTRSQLTHTGRARPPTPSRTEPPTTDHCSNTGACGDSTSVLSEWPFSIQYRLGVQSWLFPLFLHVLVLFQKPSHSDITRWYPRIEWSVFMGKSFSSVMAPGLMDDSFQVEGVVFREIEPKRLHWFPVGDLTLSGEWMGEWKDQEEKKGGEIVVDI